MNRCTNCGRYPFCEDITTEHCKNVFECENYIKRYLENVSNYKESKFSTGKENS